MTIQTRISDGEKIKTRLYRKVYKGKNLAEHRDGFLAQQEHSKWGVMWQLRGKERILISQFGNIPEAGFSHET